MRLPLRKIFHHHQKEEFPLPSAIQYFFNKNETHVASRFFIVLIICLSGFYKMDAAHLIGGDISYTCLGGNAYAIKLRIYRDCAGGGAQFDANAFIAIYDTADNLIATLAPALGAIIKVSTDSTGNPCVTAPPGLCSEYTDYFDTIQLPPVPGGYVITHQRCCRNSGITNINSMGIGNTYTVSIPSMDTTCNSSPQFVGVAPVVICLNKNFELPLTVAEPDGDSLYFEFCEILNGGASSGGGGNPCLTVVPNPPCPPPYDTIPFVAPFSSGVPIPSSPTVTVNPQTGLLSGRPTQIGQFAVGVCVTEYRNGLPLSTVRLDYQFNVTSCISTVVSDFVTPVEDPEILCDGLLVHFENESQNAAAVFWDFGDPTTLNDTSSLDTPSYFYNIAGQYTVTLIADPSSPCGDTTTFVFDVQPRVNPEFRDSGIYCLEANEIFFRPLPNFYPADADFSWDFGADASPGSDSVFQPGPVSYSSPGEKFVTFTVRYGVCEKIYTDSLEISNLSVGVDAGADQIIDFGEIIQLNASGGDFYEWSASTPVFFANVLSGATTVRIPRAEDDTVTFYVEASDELGCAGRDSLQVFLRPPEPSTINYFSPNGDGINDFLDVSNLNPNGDCALHILNRWGAEVFIKENYQNDWNGTNRGGNPLPDGTYYFLLDCPETKLFKAPVTLVRW